MLDKVYMVTLYSFDSEDKDKNTFTDKELLDIPYDELLEYIPGKEYGEFETLAEAKKAFEDAKRDVCPPTITQMRVKRKYALSFEILVLESYEINEDGEKEHPEMIDEFTKGNE